MGERERGGVRGQKRLHLCLQVIMVVEGMEWRWIVVVVGSCERLGGGVGERGGGGVKGAGGETDVSHDGHQFMHGKVQIQQ
jgi:hypothetical protein